MSSSRHGASQATTMKAYVYERYDPPENLELREVARPAPGPGEALVRVRASSVNPYDWHMMRGDPLLVRLVKGLRRPKKATVPGADVAGTVESVGVDVTNFAPGDEVFAMVLGGGFGEYALVLSKRLAAKPAGVSFEQVAAIPVAGLAALQGLRDCGRIAPGQRVLVNGAAGGIGSFAVQLAKHFGAEVTGACSTRNVELVTSIGADHVIDYTAADFTVGERRYDLVFDAVGNRSLRHCRRILTRKGTFVAMGGGGGRILGPAEQQLRVALLAPFVSQRLVNVSLAPNAEDLALMAGLIEEGHITPVIDRIYRLEEAPAAVRYAEGGHARGKVIVTV